MSRACEFGAENKEETMGTKLTVRNINKPNHMDDAKSATDCRVLVFIAGQLAL